MREVEEMGRGGSSAKEDKVLDLELNVELERDGVELLEKEVK